MAEQKRAQYIIEMLFEGGTAKQQLKTLEQDLLNLNKTERAELKKAVKEKMVAIQSIAKAARDNSGNDAFTKGLKTEVEALKSAFETLKKVFPYEEFAQGGKILTQEFNKMDQSLVGFNGKIKGLRKDIDLLRNDFRDLGFKGVITEAEQLQNVIDKISNTSLIPELDGKSVSDVKKFIKTMEDSLSSISIDVEIEYEGLSRSDLKKKLKDNLGVGDKYNLTELLGIEIDNQIESLPELVSDVHKATEGTHAWTVANEKLAKTIRTINVLENEHFKHNKTSYFANIDGDVVEAKGSIKKVFDDLDKEVKKHKGELEKATKSIIDGLASVNVKLELTKEDKEKFRNKINKFVGDVSTEIEPLNVALDIKDKGLKKEEIQERIKEAKEWRQEVAAALNKDKEKVSVYFGVQAVTDSLYDQLQKYFEDNEIDLHINKEALAKEIQAAVASGGIAGGSVNLSGGTVDINPETLAKAVAAGMQAFFTGDFTSLSTGKPKSEETPAKKPEKKFYLDPNNDYNKEVAAMFKEIIKYAQGTNKPNKQTRSFLEGKLVGTQYWDDDKKEVNFDALENADPTDLIDTLSHIVEKHGVTLVDQFGELAKSAKSQLIKNFRGELLELIGTHNFKQTTVDESIKDQKRQEMWESYSKKSRFTSGLGSLMGVVGSDVDNLKLPDVADIDKLIEYVKENTFTQEDVDEIERKYQEQRDALEQANKNFKQKDLDDVSEQVKQKQSQVNVANARKDTEQAKLLQAELDALKVQENQLKEAQKTQQNASNDFEKVSRERRRIVGSFNQYNGVLSQLETFKTAREKITDESDSSQKAEFLNEVSKFADGVREVYREITTELKKYEWGIEVKGFKDVFKVSTPSRVGKLDNAIQGEESRIVKPHLYKAPESLKGYVEDQPDRTDVLRQEVVVKKFRTHEMIDKELGEAEALLQEAKNNKDEAKILQQQSRIATLKAEKDTLPTTSKRWEEANGAKNDISRQEQAAQKQANKYMTARAEHENKYTALMQKQNTLEEDIESREKQIAETEQYIKENSGDARKLAGARKRLENREKAFQAAEEKYNQLEQSRIDAIREYQDARRNLEDVEKGNYKNIDYLDNQIAQLEEQQQNPLKHREDLAGKIKVGSDGVSRLEGGIYQDAYNNTRYYRDLSKENAKKAKLKYELLEKEEQTIREFMNKATNEGDVEELDRLEKELTDTRRKITQYKEQEQKELQTYEKYQADLNEILRKRNGTSKVDKSDFTKDAKEYIKQQLADKKAHRAQLGADPRVEARARVDRTERNAQITTTQTTIAKTELDKAQKELEQVQQDELVQKSQEIEEHKNHVRIMKETNERQRKEIEEIEKQRAEVKNSAPIKTEEKLKKTASDIESLSKEVLELQQKVQQSRAEAEQIDKFVQDAIEDENYKKPTYDIDYNEDDKTVVDKHGAYIARSAYLRGIADGTLNKDSFAPKDLAESMSKMVQSIINSREVVDALSNDFGLDKLGSEDEVKSEVQRRLNEASAGKIKLSPIIADYYAKIVSDGSVAATQWLESTKTSANANIEQQKALLQAASADDDASADMLDAQMKEANEHLKTTYQTRVSEWFEAIRSKLKIVGAGKGKNATADAKQVGALAAKEIEGILRLIDDALKGYGQFKSKEYYEELNKLERQFKSTKPKDEIEAEKLKKKYDDDVKALEAKEAKRLREELFGDNAKISRQRNKFAYTSYKDRDVNANTATLANTQEQIKNSERYNLLLARQAELLREIADARGDEQKTATLETRLNDINSELTQYQMASVNVSEYLELKKKEAEALSQIRKARSENKKESEIKPMEDDLANINKELNKYKEFEAQIKHSHTLSLFEDDVEFADKYRARVAEIIKLEQEVMLARAKGETSTQIDGRYAQINTKRQELEVSVYDALQKKQESLLNSIKSNTEETKQTASTIDSLKKNNADPDVIKKHKRHQDELERSAKISADQLELVNIELTELEINKRRVAELDMGKMLYKADEGTVKEYINLIRTLIALEQELALTTAQGGDTSDVKKRLNKHKPKIKKEIDKMTEDRHKRDASLSPNAWALQHLKDTQKDYDLALQQRYAVKGRKKRVENRLADVVDDDKYSTSGQYIRHQEAVKDMLTNEYVYSDKYKADKKAGKDQALQETLEEVAKIIRTRIENAYKESGKNLDDTKIQEEINQTVENQVKAVKFRLDQSLGKKGMTIDPKKMDEAYQLFSQGGWEGVRETFEDEFEGSAEYKALVEERQIKRKAALEEEIDAIKQEAEETVSIIRGATEETYEPLKKKMDKISHADLDQMMGNFSAVLSDPKKTRNREAMIASLGNAARSAGATKDQRVELERELNELSDKTIKDVRLWFDRLVPSIFPTGDELRNLARESLVFDTESRAKTRIDKMQGKYDNGAFRADAETEKQFRERINEAMASYVNDSLNSDKLAELFKDTDLGDSETTKGILELFKQKMVDYVYDIGKHYAENLEVKNGTIENEFAREGEEKIINIRQQVIDRLNGELAQLEKDGVLAEQNIAAIETERKAAMEYGGVKYSDVIDAEVLREMSMLKSRLELEKEYQAELSATIDKLRAEGASSEELGVFGEELDKTTEKVNRLQNLINNDDILLELMREERTNEDALKKRTPEELKMLYEEKKATAEGQLESDNERVRQSAAERIARYDAILADLDKKIEANAAKEREKNDPMNIIANKFADAIKKSLGGNGGLNVDATGLATEATLTQIYEILVGIVQAMGGKVIRDPEKDAMLAELRSLKAKKATANGQSENSNKTPTTNNNTGKSGTQKKNREPEPDFIIKAREYKKELENSTDPISDVRNAIKAINDLGDESKGTEEYLLAQVKLQKALNAYFDKGKTMDFEGLGWDEYKRGEHKGEKYHNRESLMGYLLKQDGITEEGYNLKRTEAEAKEATKTIVDVKPQVAPNAVAEEVKENTEQTPPVAEVKPEVAKEDANAYVTKLQEILGGVSGDTKGTENQLKAVSDAMGRLKQTKGAEAFNEFKESLLALQSGKGSIEDATQKAQKFVDTFANYKSNTFSDLSKWFGKDVQADATTLLGIVKQIFEVTSNEQKVRKAARKAEGVKPAQQIAEAAQAEAAATAQVTEEKAEQKAIESSYTTEDARRERELTQKLGGYTGPQVDFSDVDIGLATEETLQKIFDVIQKIKTEGIKKGGSATAKKKKLNSIDEAKLIQQRALYSKDAIMGLGAYEGAYKQLEEELNVAIKKVDKTDSKGKMPAVKALAQRISAMSFNILKEAATWDEKVRNADKLYTAGKDESFGKVNKVVDREQLRKDMTSKAMEFAGQGKEFKEISFDGTTLNYQLVDKVTGSVQKLTMEWSELHNQVAITSDKSVAKLSELASKVDTFEGKFKNALGMGYLDENDDKYQAYREKIEKLGTEMHRISAKPVEEITDEEHASIEKLRYEALQAADEVTKRIAQNKKQYTGTTEMNAADRQYGKLESNGILDRTDLSMVEEYKTKYNEILAIQEKWKAKYDGKGLLREEAQKELRKTALEAQNLGKELEKAVESNQRLQQDISNSGTYNGQKIGGWFEVKDDVGVYDQMVAKLKELGAEHIKVDRVRKIATGTIRHNNRTVSDLTVKYDELSRSLGRYQKQERESLTGLPAFLSGFQKKFNSIMQYLTMTMSIHQVLSQLRRGVQYVKEIDLALTELRKVTDETEETYERFLQTAAKTGERLGSTISAVTEATATFAKLGYSMAQATEMAEAAIVYKNVGDNIASTEDAADSIISTMKGFGLEATESMAIVDKFNEVGNRFAITSQGIGEALRLSASALNEGKNSLDESIALITAANEVVNDPSSVGTALKTLTLRLRGSKTELEEAGLDIENMATTTSQLQAKLLALTGGKVDIMASPTEFKNTTQILREMAGAWEDMNDIQRASALELMGGKRQANTLSALIQNFDTVEEAIEASAKSAGKQHCPNVQKCA